MGYSSQGCPMCTTERVIDIYSTLAYKCRLAVPPEVSAKPAPSTRQAPVNKAAGNPRQSAD